MDWQQIGVGVALLAATAYLARAAWKTCFGQPAGCGSACGKCVAPEPDTGRRIRLL